MLVLDRVVLMRFFFKCEFDINVYFMIGGFFGLFLFWDRVIGSLRCFWILVLDGVGCLKDINRLLGISEFIRKKSLFLLNLYLL